MLLKCLGVVREYPQGYKDLILQLGDINLGTGQIRKINPCKWVRNVQWNV